MEIRIAEREKGRMKNIEIYSEKEFNILLHNQLGKAVDQVGTLAKFFPNYKNKLKSTLVKNVMTIFRNRLKANLNR